MPAFRTKQVRDGSIQGYLITRGDNDMPLLKVHYHGNTSSPFDRVFKAFFRSPVLKWDVENYGLFSDVANGTALGTITDVFPDNRIFTPAPGRHTMPHLEMQSTSAVGVRYLLAVTDVPQPVGAVECTSTAAANTATTNVAARFAPRSETYRMALHNCTREEAVLWLCLLVATDMKRRKSQQNPHFARAPVLSPALF